MTTTVSNNITNKHGKGAYLKRYWWLTLIFLSLILGITIVALIPPSAAPMPEASSALESDTSITVSTSPWLSFTPTGKELETGLIIYPGGRVDPSAYAPSARALAKQGYLVTIVPMPLDLAFFNPNAAMDVIETYPEVENWAIGGHSLGGVAAAQFVSNHPSEVSGIYFWGSYPANSDDLTQIPNLTAVSIYGTNDGLSTPEKVLAASPLLPQDTMFVPIDGGNHAQFGWYGEQNGDLSATISREIQQKQIVDATAHLLETISK